MLYEFRTLKDRTHASLIMLAGCDNDIEAILTAQFFLRKGEGLEVWREDKLIYRLAARVPSGRRAKRSPAAKRPVPESRGVADAWQWLLVAKRLVLDLRRSG
jgi:hypothetical protein